MRRPPSHNRSGQTLGDLVQGACPPHPSLIPPQEILDLVKLLNPVNQSESGLSKLFDRLSKDIYRNQSPLNVGIFEGAFDPPHRGHEETARAAIGIGNLDLLIVTCYPSAHRWKPHLSAHGSRLEMTASYFKDDPWTLVSPLPRGDLERLLRKHLTTGVIGSDTFNRFIASGIPANFNTDKILVTERSDSPLEIAPITLDGRPVLYIGATQLAFNTSSSTELRATLRGLTSGSSPSMLNAETIRIAQARKLYPATAQSLEPEVHPSPTTGPLEGLPTRYRSCSIAPRRGLMNGLLSESFLHEVRNQTGEVVAFRKTLPPHRDPLQSLADELYGLEHFNKLNLSNVHAPHAILDEAHPSLWIDRAPGETLASLLTGYERGERSLADACAGLQGVGAMLRELHSRYPLPFSPAASTIIQRHMDEVAALVAAAPTWQINAPSCQRVLQGFYEAGNSLLTKGVTCSLVHGDANCGNFLWSASDKTVWVIDLQRFGTQLRTQEPAFSSYEYHQFISSLHYFPNFGFRGVRGHAEYLMKALEEAYGALPPAEQTFFQARWTLQRLLGRHLRVIPPQAR